jgi:uncharacterized repeat protein (TIGR01451 family)
MQDAMEPTVRRLWRGAGVALATLALSAAMASGASAAPVCGTTAPQVCVDLVGTPATVSPSTALSPTFVSYDVSVVNQATRTVTHVTLANTLPAGSTLVSATPSTGTCAAGADGVSCAFGSVPSGGRVTATILVRAPEVEGQVADTVTVRFDEGFNDSPTADPKQDTVTTSTPTLVAAVAGEAASLVPSGAEVRLDTDPTRVDVATPQDPNIGKARVPASVHPTISATLDEENAPFTCPNKQICRDGAWVHADIGDGQAFSPALEFELHWSQILVPAKQSVKNLAVLHTACLVGCPIEVVSRRCSSSNPAPAELPCLSGVVETASDFRATLHSKTNGYMR